MKHLILLTLFATTYAAAIDTNQETHWLQDHINKCKEYTRALGDRREANCAFIHSYIAKFYLPLCGGQGLRPEGLGGYWKSTHMDKSQKEVCAMITEALTHQSFVEKIIK